jgi:hypothetical protein
MNRKRYSQPTFIFLPRAACKAAAWSNELELELAMLELDELATTFPEDASGGLGFIPCFRDTLLDPERAGFFFAWTLDIVARRERDRVHQTRSCRYDESCDHDPSIINSAELCQHTVLPFLCRSLSPSLLSIVCSHIGQW